MKSFIHWFGRGRNNYGWIVRTEDIDNFHKISNYIDGYFFHKNNIIDQELLDLLVLEQDEKLGEGIYIQFDLVPGKNSKLEAININLFKDIGTINKIVKNSTIYSRIKCEDGSLIDSVNDNFQSDDIVLFGVRRINNNRHQAILIDKIEDENTICDYITSSNPTIFIKSLITHINLNILSLEEIQSKISERKTLLTDLKPINVKLKKQLAQKIPSISIKYSELRCCFTTPLEYSQLFNQYINELETKIQDEIIQELIYKIQSTNSHQQIDYYWKNIKYLQENLEYKGYLWEVAPEEYKLKKIKERYQKFFVLVKKFAESSYPDEHKISGNWQELYSLNQDEQELIKKWTDKDLDDDNNYHEFVKMVAARGAEKLVAKYYESIGYDVEDTSIQQIELSGGRNWEKYDIQIKKQDNIIYLDVKNARFSRNSKVYSSFCVPQFKQFRQKNIKIIGVLSPLIKTERKDKVNKEKNNIRIIWFLDNELNKKERRKLEAEAKEILEKKYQNQTITEDDIIKYLQKQVDDTNCDPIKILGTFDKKDIDDLETLFKDDILQNINISEQKYEYYPHWLFDYDEDFYAQQIDIIKKFRNLIDEEIPSPQEFSMIEKQYKALPLFLASQRQLPNEWTEQLPEWKYNFIRSIIDIKIQSRIKLPHILLAILKHFLRMVVSNSNDQDYDPRKYLEILYTHQNLDEDPHPLKIYDPVKDQQPNSPKESPTIINFCETLQILYERRENLKLHEFVKFNFKGKGWLTGEKLEPNTETTILAYCECGYRPLIRNEEPGKICKTCYPHRLICDKCKCCKNDCSEYKKRIAQKPLNIVILVGRVGQDPSIKFFGGGKIKCNLSLAVNRRQKNNDKPDWFELELWDEIAKCAADYVRKGQLIGVKGTLRFHTWVDDHLRDHSKPVIQVEELYIHTS